MCSRDQGAARTLDVDAAVRYRRQARVLARRLEKFVSLRASPLGVPNKCSIQISTVVIGQTVHKCPESFFKIIFAEGQIQRSTVCDPCKLVVI
jgi:hypothetical protein